MSKYEEIRTKITELEKQAEELLASEKKAAIQDIKEKIRLYGITPAEIGMAEKVKGNRGRPAGPPRGATAEKKPASRATKRKSKVQPKYRGPNGETWAGRGKRPLWVNEILASGGDMQDYLADR